MRGLPAIGLAATDASAHRPGDVIVAANSPASTAEPVRDGGAAETCELDLQALLGTVEDVQEPSHLLDVPLLDLSLAAMLALRKRGIRAPLVGHPEVVRLFLPNETRRTLFEHAPDFIQLDAANGGHEELGHPLELGERNILVSRSDVVQLLDCDEDGPLARLTAHPLERPVDLCSSAHRLSSRLPSLRLG